MTTKKNTRNNTIVSVVAGISVAVVGYALFITLAASSAGSAEAESGQAPTTGAAVIADPSASMSKAVLFGKAVVDPGPDPNPGGGASPSGEAMPKGDLPGWKQIFTDDFTIDAPMGSWGSDDPSAVVYTGDGGGKWVQYPPSYKDTYQKRSYRSDEVLSVKNGVLNFYLHDVDGQPAPANPSPMITGDSQYQTYGRYTARFKTDTRNAEPYYVAWLLWPQSEVWPRDGEEDFPEGSLSGNIGGFHHYAGNEACQGCQDGADSDKTFDSWHTYTIEWKPDNIKYILDGETILDSGRAIPNTPMRWQLQTETNGNATGNVVNLDVDWVAAYSYQP